MLDILEHLRKSGIAYEENVPMSAKTTFRIGGAAELVLLPESKEEAAECVRLCGVEKPFVLGCGSNLLVKDSGISRPVISTKRLKEISLEGNVIRCGAGVKLSELCWFAQKNSLTGLEFAYGIPGSAGGAAYMNAGAYGGEMKDILQKIEYVNAAGELCELPVEKAELGYRHSVFMNVGGLVTRITVRLVPGDADEIKAKMQEIMQKRRDKQPLEYPSAGSVFKRPAGHFTGELIQRCGLKGKNVGGAYVSEKHAGFMVNMGGATAADVRALIAVVQTVVEQETGILLEPELKFV